MKKTHWPTRLAAGCLVTLTLVGVAFAAGQQGSQSDPLVTLSYLTQKATPSILSQVDSKLTARETELKKQLSAVRTSWHPQAGEAPSSPPAAHPIR